MVPNYVITLVLVMIALNKLFRGRHPQSSESIIPVTSHKPRTFGKLLLLVLICLVTFLPPLALPVFHFETPTGSYAVGTTQYHWKDPSRNRGLNIQVWYPADHTEDAAHAPYSPDLGNLAEGLSQAYAIPEFLLDYIGLVHTPAYMNVPVAQRATSYPVILFSHGFPGGRYTNTFQTVDLASHGFIVVSVEHTDGSLTTVFPGGKYIGVDPNLPHYADLAAWDQLVSNIWVKDTQFVIDKLEQLNRENSQSMFRGRLDLQRIGMLGHSFGGANAAQVMLTDKRVQAAINMDGTFFGTGDLGRGLPRPFLFMSSDPPITSNDLLTNPSDSVLAANGLTRDEYKVLQQIPVRKQQALQNGGQELLIPHADHLTFSDFYLISPVLSWMNGRFDTREVQRSINEQTLNFFVKHLNYKE
ncbi:carboxylic ester hydrolase [Paenibacillus sp. YPG26]|uniref:alpha/beta hydrolase family protein n=1 Tax=Paenibacillus sp. YPG26 TaxID=2878915 RepID=UPI00203F4A72|nr:carboxylic ester hydrolase [Paenibacillus sp. YPG26]USB34273.1 carboxylic ester hydrolase [Paenibacillus sp. YPG26]